MHRLGGLVFAKMNVRILERESQVNIESLEREYS
jgi:hypothetical protein